MRVIGYGRVSTEEQESNYSMDAQRHRFETLVKQNRWQSLGFFSETGSGTSVINRPVLCNILQRVQDKGVDALWVKETDRLSRPENLGDLSLISQTLESANTLLMVDTRSLDLREDNSVLMLDFEGDDGVPEPEDKGKEFGDDVVLFTSFMRSLAAPPRVLPEDKKERDEIEDGFKVFRSVGCASCHVPEMVTVDEGTLINGKTYRVPKALGNKKFHPYGDFLLHDIGTGPTIPQEGLPPESRGMIRTAALWGLGTRLANSEPLLHDGSSRTIEEAILKHKKTAAQEAEEFRRLSERDRTRLLKFLRSL